MKTKIGMIVLAAGLCTTATSALAEIVVIVNPKNAATRMFGEQAAQFYLGKSAMFTPVDYTPGVAIRDEFYAKVLQKDPAQVKSIWSRLIFTGKGNAPQEFKSAAEVKKAVAADVNAIGYIDKAAVDDSVKVILTVP